MSSQRGNPSLTERLSAKNNCKISEINQNGHHLVQKNVTLQENRLISVIAGVGAACATN